MSFLRRTARVDQPLLDIAPEAAQLPDEDPLEVRLWLTGAGDDLLQAGPMLEVGTADAGVRDDLARGAGGRDGSLQLGDLRVDGQLVLRLVGGRDPGVNDAVRAGRDLDHSDVLEHATIEGDRHPLGL
jgi:hypothetical protein